MKRIKTMLIVTSLAVVLAACSKNEEITESSIEETEQIVDTVEETVEDYIGQEVRSSELREIYDTYMFLRKAEMVLKIGIRRGVSNLHL